MNADSMQQWGTTILTSEFLWGIVLGLIIANIGARTQAKLQFEKLIDQQKADFLLFAQDIITNIMRVSKDIEEARRRSKAIHHDLLALIDAEVGIFGRNREHSIRLDDDLRSEIRQYITDVALRKTDIVVKLSDFERQMRLAYDLKASGNGPAGERADQAASTHLVEANKAADDLIHTARDGDNIIKKIQSRMNNQ